MMAVPLSIFGAMIRSISASVHSISIRKSSHHARWPYHKHGILMVQFAKERLAAGISPRAAIEEAARVRLRPILMTTRRWSRLMPLVIASGAGAASRHAIGLVITMGMAWGQCSRSSSCRCFTPTSPSGRAGRSKLKFQLKAWR